MHENVLISTVCCRTDGHDNSASCACVCERRNRVGDSSDGGGEKLPHHTFIHPQLRVRWSEKACM